MMWFFEKGLFPIAWLMFWCKFNEKWISLLVASIQEASY